MFLVLLLYALFGFTFTLGKIVLSYAQPFFVVGLRMLIGGTGLMSFIYLSKRKHCYPSRDDMWYYGQAALFGVFIPYCARAWALQYISTTKSALLFNFMPFFTALFAFLVHRERLTRNKFAGLCIGFMGMIPILLANTSTELNVGHIGFISLPELATLLAVMSFSYNFIVMQTLVKTRGCDPLLANGMSMLWGGILAFNLSLVTETNFVHGDPWVFLGILATLIVISNILCANLQAHLLRYYSSTFLAFASFLSPLWAAFYGSILLGEKISWHFFASLGLVCIGLGLYYYDEFTRTSRQVS